MTALFRRQVRRQVNLAGLGIETYQPILFGERENLRHDLLEFSGTIAMITWLPDTSMLDAQGRFPRSQPFSTA